MNYLCVSYTLHTEFPSELKRVISKIDKEHEASQTKQEQPEIVKNEEEQLSSKEEIQQDRLLLPQLEEKFSKSQAYGYDKITFGIFSSVYGTFETIVFLLLGFLPYMWDKAAAIVGKDSSEIRISLMFLVLVTLVGMVTSLPFELYSTFRIEKKHGFNKQTIGLFFSDKVKSLLLSFLIGGPFTALLLKIIHWGGEYFYLYVWAFLFVFSVIMMTVYPVLIMPLFNKYEPLPDGKLKESIYALADRLKYPLTKLFVMDGSKRSSHSNAFIIGFGRNKRIVLFDTLLQQVKDKEILGILGHELGHWKLGHTLTNFAVTQLYFGAAFYCFSLCIDNSKELFAAFGFSTHRPVPTIIALLLFFQTIWAPLDKVISFLMTLHSRHAEFAADKFSVDLGMSKELQTGLCKIHLENLGAMCPDWLYSTYHYSHPPLVERLSAMIRLEKKMK
jgi:STE24 endopeptidase